MNLKLEINKELDVMIKLGISAEEWFFIQLLLLFKEGETDSLYRYYQEAKKDSIPRTLLESLQEKNIIEKTYKLPIPGEPFNPNDIPLSNDFTKKYFRESGEMGLDLLRVYPAFIVSGNKSYPIKNITKHFRTLEDFAVMYGKAIKFNKKKHDEIIELVEWAKENNAIHFSLPEFVISRKWELLEEIRSGKIPNYYTPTFDTTELI